MTGFVQILNKLVLDTFGLVLNMTEFVLNMIGILLNMTGCFLNMTRFVLNMTELILKIALFDLHKNQSYKGVIFFVNIDGFDLNISGFFLY